MLFQPNTHKSGKCNLIEIGWTSNDLYGIRCYEVVEQICTKSNAYLEL